MKVQISASISARANTIVAVKRVANNAAPNISAVNPQLVCSASYRLQFQDNWSFRGIFLLLIHSPMRDA